MPATIGTWANLRCQDGLERDDTLWTPALSARIRRSRSNLPERPRTRGAEGATRPETLRHPNGRFWRTLESGPRGPTEGERNRESPVPNLSGIRTEGRRVLEARRLFF